MDLSERLKLSDKSTPASEYDRAKELKAFDDTKAGVKGLVDAGIRTVPKIFIRPPDELAEELDFPHVQLQVPIIDLDGLRGTDRRKEILENVLAASETWGFFQVVNHGVPIHVLENMLHGVRKFHEQDVEAKKEFHSRDSETKQVKYHTNYDLYYSRAANWRDTLTVYMRSLQNWDNDQLPSVCRDEMVVYVEHMKKFGEIIFELLSESLGLKPNHLQSLECLERKTFVFHYYPECPEPEITLGSSAHKDPCFLTILLQDQIGGLQVLHQNQWIDVPPIQGGLIVNIGDFLQAVSNDKLKSVAHRVVANRVGPRISVASLFQGQMIQPKLYGPIKELLSQGNAPVYRDFTIKEYMSTFQSEALGRNSSIDCFKI
ncbi:hypothetical protein ACFE04_005923 [Oxalis oulophora]